MPNILTADEFLTLILATIRVRSDRAVLDDGDLDWRFERAYERLVERRREQASLREEMGIDED